MFRSVLLLCAGAALFPVVSAQTPRLLPEGHALRGAQQALIAEDRAAAQAALDRVQLPADPADRQRIRRGQALLRLALLPEQERIEPLLAFAESHSQSPEGETALVAALHLVAEGGVDALFETREDGAWADIVERARLIAQKLPSTQQGERSEATTLLDALFERGSRRGSMIRLGSVPAIPVVGPLASALTVRWTPSPQGRGASAAGPARVDTLEPGRGETDTPTPGPGQWELEVRAPSGQRARRTVLLSDLDVVVQAFPTGAVVAALLDGVPQSGVHLKARRRGTDPATWFTAVTDPRGLAELNWPLSDSGFWDLAAEFSTANGGVHHASVSWWASEDRCGDNAEQLVGHLMVDRPLYRPGEQIQGRVALRRAVGRQRPGHLSGALDYHSDEARSVPVTLVATWPGGATTHRDLVSDDHGVIPFTLDIPAAVDPGSIRVRLRETDAEHHIIDATPARIAFFRRPPLFLTLDGPERWIPGSSNPTFQIGARWPFGSPATGLTGEITAVVGTLRHQERFVTRADGLAHSTLLLDDLTPALGEQATVSIRVTAPDGQVLDARRTLMIGSPPEPPATRGLVLTVDPTSGPPEAGKPLHLHVKGPPDSWVLVSLARETSQGSTLLKLDAAGHGKWNPLLTAAAYPEIWCTAHGCGSDEAYAGAARSKSLRLSVAPGGGNAVVRVTPDRDSYLPGSAARLTFSVRDPDGRPRAGMVAVSIVDETLFSLADDRTPNPTLALAPQTLGLLLAKCESLARGNPWTVLGQLLERGTALNPGRSSYGGPGGAASGHHGRGQGPATNVRGEFRSTAAWNAALILDEHGQASWAFTLPEDLTRWRITTCFVDSVLGSGQLQHDHLRTVLPLSVEPVLPRLLRSGDEVEVPVLVAQDGGVPEVGHLHVSCSGSVTSTLPQPVVETTPGRGVTRPVTLTAGQAGPAQVEARFVGAEGVVRDGTRREVPVISREISRTSAETTLARGHTEILMPGAGPGRLASLEVEVVGSLDGIRAAAADYLTDYPWGCAEQTASRLVPVFLAAEARRHDQGAGQKADLLSPLQVQRLEVGLARLAGLQQGNGSFAWWPGDEGDLEVTAVVLRRLLLARSCGLATDFVGLRLDADLGVLASATRLVLGSVTGGSLVERLVGGAEPNLGPAMELSVIRLTLDPSNPDARLAARAILREAEDLPVTLVARAAAAVAGTHRSEALAALSVLRARSEALDEDPPALTGTLGGPAVRSAALLDLLLQLEPESPLIEKLVAELLRRHRAGCFDHTAGTADALVSLTRLASARTHAGAWMASPDLRSVTLRAETEQGVVTIPVDLQAGGSRPVGIPLPLTTQRVTVDNPHGNTLVATVLRREAEDGVTSRGWAAPFEVTTTLSRLIPNEDGTLESVAVDDGRVRVGEALEVRVDVRVPPDQSHLLVECPIPAGFELVHDDRVTVFDDRVGMGLRSLDAEGRGVAHFRFIPSLVGQVAFPGVRVVAMYRPDLDGASAGRILRVLPPNPEGARHLSLLGRARALRALESAVAACSGDPTPGSSWVTLAGLPVPEVDRALEPSLLHEMGRERAHDQLDDWILSLGKRGRIVQILSEISLERTVAALGGPAAEALNALASSLSQSSYVQDWLESMSRPRSDLEHRLLFFVVGHSHRWPSFLDDPSERVSTLNRWLSAGDVTPSATGEARSERWEALTSDPRFGRLLVSEVRRALDARWTRAWRIASDRNSGDRSPMVELSRLFQHLEGGFLEANADGRAVLADVIESLRSWSWPTEGAAPPAHFTEWQRSVLDGSDGLRAEARRTWRDVAQAENANSGGLMALSVAGDPAAAQRWVRTLISEAAEGVVPPTVLSTLTMDAPRALLKDVEEPLSAIANNHPSKDLRQAAILGLHACDGWDRLSDDALLVVLGFSSETSEDIQDQGFCEAFRRPTLRATLWNRLQAGTFPQRRRILEMLPWQEPDLRVLPLEDALILLSALEPSLSSPTWRRAVSVIRGGPYSDGELAAAFAHRRDRATRHLLLRSLRDLKTTISLDDNDPFASVWRTVLNARNGDEEAAAELRRWHRAERTTPPVAELERTAFALAPHLNVEDVLSFAGSLEDAALRELLDSAETALLAAALAHPDFDRSDALSPETACRVYSRLPIPTVIRHLEGLSNTPVSFQVALVVTVSFRSVSSDQALELLWGPLDPAAVEEVARRLMDHPDPSVAVEARAQVQELTGIPAPHVDPSPPGDPAQQDESLLRRIHRFGTRAATKALKGGDPTDRRRAARWLQRQGWIW